MKRNLFTLMALTLCLCLIVPTAMAGGGGYPYGESFPGDPGCGPMTPPAPQTTVTTGADVHVDVHVDVDVSVTTCVHHPGCPHWWIHDQVTCCVQRWSQEELCAFKTSKEAAQDAVDLLKEVLCEKVKVTKYKIHPKTANGWVEIWIKNPNTCKTEKSILNAYSHSGAGTCANRNRMFVFTTKHRNNVKLADYPTCEVLTTLEADMETAVFEFVARLYERFGIDCGSCAQNNGCNCAPVKDCGCTPSQSACDCYRVVDELEGECGG